MLIEGKIRDYLSELLRKYPTITAIWLIGSRANGCETATSDWDLLVFADEGVLAGLCSDVSLDKHDVDLLIVHDGDSFSEPWGDNPKRGRLSEWGWSILSENEAEYTEKKWAPDEESTKRFGAKYGLEFGQTVEVRARAVLVWRNSSGLVSQPA